MMGDTQGKRVLVDALTYNAAIIAYVNGGQWRKALQLMEGMQGQGSPCGYYRLPYSHQCL